MSLCSSISLMSLGPQITPDVLNIRSEAQLEAGMHKCCLAKCWVGRVVAWFFHQVQKHLSLSFVWTTSTCTCTSSLFSSWERYICAELLPSPLLFLHGNKTKPKSQRYGQCSAVCRYILFWSQFLFCLSCHIKVCFLLPPLQDRKIISSQGQHTRQLGVMLST